MAKKRKQTGSSTEVTDRENCRGRTVCRAVRKAIQSGTKIPLQWNHRKLPCGEHKTTFATYIGVIARQRVGINYSKWEDLPKEVPDEIFDLISKAFIVPEDRRGHVLKQASKRWRAFKFRLRKDFMYEYDENGEITNVIIWTPPTLYPWITPEDWKTFIEMCIDPDFKIMSELNQDRAKKRKTSYRGGRKGYSYYEEEIAKELRGQGVQVADVPRHLVWIRAHSREEKGILKFDNPANLEIAQAIKALEAQHNRGEIDAKGRHDILARALKTPEHGGCVRGVGGGVTNTDYFGYNKPVPPKKLQSELKDVKEKLNSVTNSQNFLMSFLMTNFHMTPDQLHQFQLGNSSGNLGGFGGNQEFRSGTFGELLNSHGLEATHSDVLGDKLGDKQSGGSQFRSMATQGVQDFQFRFVSKPHHPQQHEVSTETYLAPWPDPKLGHEKEYVPANSFNSNLQVQTEQEFRSGTFGELLNSHGLSATHSDVLGDKQSGGSQFRSMATQGVQDFQFQLASKPHHPQQHEVSTETYHVAWPDPNLDHEKDYVPANSFNSNLQAETEHSEQYTTNQAFPEGADSDCSLAIEQANGVHIVAIGQVYIGKGSEIIKHHFKPVPTGCYRVCIKEDIYSNAPLPFPEGKIRSVSEGKDHFLLWPSHLVFPIKKVDKHVKELKSPSAHMPSSHSSSFTKRVVAPITSEEKLKLTTTLISVCRKLATEMKNGDKTIPIRIPNSVFYNEQDICIDYEDMRDWCFQRMVRESHISTFMMHLSEMVHAQGISGVYGFCDSNFISPQTPTQENEDDRCEYLVRVFANNNAQNRNQIFFAPYTDNLHWMLAVICPWVGLVHWLDPAGVEYEPRQFPRDIINKAILAFNLKFRPQIKWKKNSPIKWKNIECPRQGLDTNCGYYVCRYMLETIQSRKSYVPDKYFDKAPSTYSQKMIDEVRDMWLTFVTKHQPIEDDDDD